MWGIGYAKKAFILCGVYRVGALLLAACTAALISPPGVPSMLEPNGPAARHIAELWWVMLAFGTAIFILVIALLFAGLLRKRRATSETEPDAHSVDVGRKWLHAAASPCRWW